MSRKRVGLAKLIELTTLTALVAAHILFAGEAMSKTECDPLNVAEAYIAKQFPAFDSSGLKRIISQKGGLWQLTYELPAGMLGGAPIVTVDMRTCKVVSAVHTQ